MKFGRITIDKKLQEDIRDWIDFEKLISEDVSTGSTTMNGYQRVFNERDIQPEWHNRIISQLPIDFNKPKSSWMVSYNKGGYQEKHRHEKSKTTTIINLVGEGALVLYDNDNKEYIKKLSVGDWIEIPGQVFHSTKPCINERIVLVIDITK